MPKITKTMQNFLQIEWVRKRNLKLFCYRWSEGDGHGDGEDGAQDPHDHDRHLGLVLAGVALQGKHDGAIPAIMAELILRIKDWQTGFQELFVFLQCLFSNGVKVPVHCYCRQCKYTGVHTQILKHECYKQYIFSERGREKTSDTVQNSTLNWF